MRLGGRDSRDRASRGFTDARPVAEHVRSRSLEPERRRKRKLRRRTFLLSLAGVCLAGSVVACIGEGGVLDRIRLARDVVGLENEIARRTAEIAELRREIAALASDPIARERVAREELGLVRPGEIDILLPRRGAPLIDAPEPALDPAIDQP